MVCTRRYAYVALHNHKKRKRITASIVACLCRSWIQLLRCLTIFLVYALTSRRWFHHWHALTMLILSHREQCARKDIHKTCAVLECAKREHILCRASNIIIRLQYECKVRAIVKETVFPILGDCLWGSMFSLWLPGVEFKFSSNFN